MLGTVRAIMYGARHELHQQRANRRTLYSLKNNVAHPDEGIGLSCHSNGAWGWGKLKSRDSHEQRDQQKK